METLCPLVGLLLTERISMRRSASGETGTSSSGRNRAITPVSSNWKKKSEGIWIGGPVKHILAVCSIFWQKNQGNVREKATKRRKINPVPRYATHC